MVMARLFPQLQLALAVTTLLTLWRAKMDKEGVRVAVLIKQGAMADSLSVILSGC